MEVTMTDEERRMFSNRLRESEAEIERLRARVVEHERGYEWSKMVQAEMGAEVELLRALLREPTPEMLDAAEQYNREHITGEWSFADCYRAMTSRALEPKP